MNIIIIIFLSIIFTILWLAANHYKDALIVERQEKERLQERSLIAQKMLTRFFRETVCDNHTFIDKYAAQIQIIGALNGLGYITTTPIAELSRLCELPEDEELDVELQNQ
jgi:high-affinity nickel permease